MNKKDHRWQDLPTKKKLIILYLISLPFIAYGIIEYFQHQNDFEDSLDNVTIDMMSCEIIDKTLYFNSISLTRSEKVGGIMLDLWFDGNCENPDSPYWRGEDWTPNLNQHIR